MEELDILLEVTDRAMQELEGIVRALGLEAEEITRNNSLVVSSSDQPRPANPFLLFDEADQAGTDLSFPPLSIRNPSLLTTITETDEETGKGVEEEKEEVTEGSTKAKSPNNLRRLLLSEHKKRRHQLQMYQTFQQKVASLRENLTKEQGSVEYLSSRREEMMAEFGDARPSLVINTAPPSRAGSRPPASLEWQPSYVEHKTSPAMAYLHHDTDEPSQSAEPEATSAESSSFPVTTPFSRIHHLSGVQDPQQQSRSHSTVSSTTADVVAGSNQGRFVRMFSSHASSGSDPPQKDPSNPSSARFIPSSNSDIKKLETSVKTASLSDADAERSSSVMRSKSVRVSNPEQAMSRSKSQDYYEYYGIQPMTPPKKRPVPEEETGCRCIIS